MRCRSLLILLCFIGTAAHGMDLPDPALCRQILEASGAPSNDQIMAARAQFITDLNSLHVGPLSVLTIEAPPRRHELPIVESEPPFSEGIQGSMQANFPLDPLRDVAFLVLSNKKTVGRGLVRFLCPIIDLSSAEPRVPNPYLKAHVLELALTKEAQAHQFGPVFLRILRQALPLNSRISFWVQHEASEMALDRILAPLNNQQNEPPKPPDVVDLLLLEDTLLTDYFPSEFLTLQLNGVLAQPQEAAKVPVIRALSRLKFKDPVGKVYVNQAAGGITRFYIEMSLQ